jgi:hypothetical protein
LTGAARQWATPRTITGGGESSQRKKELGREESGGGDLQSQVTAWPAPKARDWNSAEGNQGMERNDPDLNVIASRYFRPGQPTSTPGAESSDSGRTLRRRLNPAFVEWLMGLPLGWTDYGPVAMALWRSKARRRLSLWLTEQGYFTQGEIYESKT